MMTNAGEPVLVCPYNKAHSIIKSRMQFHLAKCRLQCPNSEKVVCPYNSTHIVAKVELEFHQQICPDRIVLDTFLYDVGNSKCPVEDVPIDVPPEALAPCEENWDEDPTSSVLDVVKERAREKNVLLNLIGAPKAERKAHRQQERLRYQRVTDAQEADKKQKSDNRKRNGESKKGETSKNKIEDQLKAQDQRKTYIGDDINDRNEEKIKNDENTFEVVKYHKKSQGKNKKPNQHPQVLYPPPSNSLKKSIIENDESMTQLTNLKRERNGYNEKIRAPSPPSSAITRLGSPELKVTKNAWEKPLNSGVRANNMSRTPPLRPIDDFPSLPVSGRGRGLFLTKY